MLVADLGLEPRCPHRRRILSPLRLPIPPVGQQFYEPRSIARFVAQVKYPAENCEPAAAPKTVQFEPEVQTALTLCAHESIHVRRVDSWAKIDG